MLSRAPRVGSLDRDRAIVIATSYATSWQACVLATRLNAEEIRLNVEDGLPSHAPRWSYDVEFRQKPDDTHYRFYVAVRDDEGFFLGYL